MFTKIKLSIKNIIKNSPLWKFKKLIQKIIVRLGDCKYLNEGMLVYGNILNLLDENKSSHSQFSQDIFLDKIIFKGKKTGFFLDIGANHPELFNNSLYFEKKGWTGLAFEPQTKLNKLWESRKTELINVALGNSEGELEIADSLTEDDKFGSLTGAVEKLGKHASKNSYKVKQRKLSNILAERNIKHVDFASIDVEGFEMNVLKGIDFNNVTIDCFVIENNKGFADRAQGNIRRYMKYKGYVFISRLNIDDVFVRKEFWEELNKAS